MARPRSGTDDAVVEILKAAEKPLTAYQILDALRPTGVQSPPVVYRALDRLLKAGQVHRLEQANAFFACHGHHQEGGAIFAVCRECGKVEEWPAASILQTIAAEAGRAQFQVATSTIEVRGLCLDCRGAGALTDPSPAHVCGPECRHERARDPASAETREVIVPSKGSEVMIDLRQHGVSRERSSASNAGKT